MTEENKDRDAWKQKDLKITEKVLPKSFTRGRVFFKTQLWKPSVLDRFKIAIGLNVLMSTKMVTEHAPGTVACGLFAQTSMLSAEELKNIPEDQLMKHFVTLNDKKTEGGVDFDKVEK